ncbi:MAG: AzlC family ABC transporter permease [Ruminococcus sp.]|nr:AzlC family ABC transporter permease [Ruminococcus sp.]
MLNALKKSFKYSLPVLFGYIPLGFAFGVMLQAAGYNALWAFFMCVFIFSGTGQYLIVSMLAVGASIPQVILVTFLLHSRYFFYGLSMIDRYHKIGGLKWYLIFGLTDETYAILSTETPPEGITRQAFYASVTFLNHCYWIIGGVLGALVGGLLPFNTTGIEFVMTALFSVLVVEQWKAHKNHLPALIGFVLPIISLLILGADNFLIPALLTISVVLMCMRPILDKEEARL